MIESLRPWYAIATPHEDIRAGRLQEAVFAAHLSNGRERRSGEVLIVR